MQQAQTRKRHAGCALALLLLAGCASNPAGPPRWITQPQETYPPSQYLVAVGEGGSRRAAENSAAAGLARIFESNIQASESLSETVTETAELLDRISKLKTDVQIGSDQNLLNVHYGDAYTDRSGRVYTAAFIPRAETAQIILQKMDENSRAVLHRINRSHQTVDPVEIYAFHRSAVRSALDSDRLLAQLDIIAPDRRPELPYDPPALYSDAAAAARRITFTVNLAGEVGMSLREALTGMGFTETKNYPALTATGTTAIGQTDLERSDLIFVRWFYNIDVRDRKDDLLFSLSDTQREGHINAEQATLRAERSLRDSVLDALPRETGRYLDRLAP